MCIVRDVDGDGRDDYAVVGGSPGTSWIQLHSGADGTVLRKYPAVEGRTWLVLEDGGDIDGDGSAEILVSYEIDQFAYVRWLSTRTGICVRAVELPPSTRATGFGDVDGDDVLDVFQSRDLGNREHLMTVRSGVSGDLLRSFGVTSAAVGTRHTNRVTWLGDLDGDGRSELVRTLGGGEIEIRSTRGEPRFCIDRWARPGAIVAAADMNGDGVREIAIGFRGSVSLYSGATGLLVTQLGDANDDFGLALAAPGDLNGDGVDDLVVTVGGFFTEDVRRYSGLDLGRITDPERSYVGYVGERVRSGGDVDGDGVRDLLVNNDRAGASGAADTLLVISGGTGEVLRVHRAKDQTPPER